MKYQAIIIGGGFYGCCIAAFLSKVKKLGPILILEKNAALLEQASINNQARIHNGYHYPRSFRTAYRSRVNLPKFIEAWPDAAIDNFTKLYAIPKNLSKVSASQFFKFCSTIGADIKPANKDNLALFDPKRVAHVYEVKEHAFDATILAEILKEDLQTLNINIHFNELAEELIADDKCNIIRSNKSQYSSKFIFNCSYSGLNQIQNYPPPPSELKHELTEMALVEVPPQLKRIGITVMDGPFFSLMPFPSRNLHTLSHVRYTPHFEWNDSKNVSPYEKLNSYHKQSRVDRMIRDASRMVPDIISSNYVDSLFEIKTILQKNEGDDGRPIMFTRHKENPNCFSVLGGKIDNIFDVLERLDNESL